MAAIAGPIDLLEPRRHLAEGKARCVPRERKAALLQRTGSNHDLLTLTLIQLDPGRDLGNLRSGPGHRTSDELHLLDLALARTVHVERLGEAFTLEPSEPSHELLEPLVVNPVCGDGVRALQLLLVARLLGRGTARQQEREEPCRRPQNVSRARSTSTTASREGRAPPGAAMYCTSGVNANQGSSAIR